MGGVSGSRGGDSGKYDECRQGRRGKEEKAKHGSDDERTTYGHQRRGRAREEGRGGQGVSGEEN